MSASDFPSQRINLTLTKEDIDIVEEFSLTQSSDKSKSSIIKDALKSYQAIHGEAVSGHLIFVYDVNKDVTREIKFKDINNSQFQRPVFISPIESRRQARVYTSVLVQSLTTLLNEEESRLHNRPPRELHVGQDDDRRLIKQLIAELKKLNKNLENEFDTLAQKEKQKINRHLHKFLENFAGTAGKGTAGLLVAGAGASLLMYLGVDPKSVGHLFSKFPIP